MAAKIKRSRLETPYALPHRALKCASQRSCTEASLGIHTGGRGWQLVSRAQVIDGESDQNHAEFAKARFREIEELVLSGSALRLRAHTESQA
jgi:hypothetical protein